jgi:hypothetical protein
MSLRGGGIRYILAFSIIVFLHEGSLYILPPPIHIYIFGSLTLR